jgi:outer membrane translocation and assembly module TamA
MQVDTDAAREVLEAAGLKGEKLDNALAGIANVRTTAEVQVRVNKGEEIKFGNVSIVKIQANGFVKPLGGFSFDQLPGLITQLEAAYAARPQEDAS